MVEKIERNNKILEMLKEGKSYTQVMEVFNMKSKGNIYQIVKRDKVRKLSTELNLINPKSLDLY